MVKILFLFLNFLKFGKTFKLPPNNASNVIYDMDLTEDEYNAYSGNDVLDYDFDNVIPNVADFKWENGVIPFEFSEENGLGVIRVMPVTISYHFPPFSATFRRSICKPWRNKSY